MCSSDLKPPRSLKCPACGHQAVARSNVQVDDGDLFKLTRDKKVRVTPADPPAMQRWYSELLRHAELRGYKNGWAYYAFQDKFKTKPPRWLDGKPAHMISPEVASWIKARNIRKAKSKEKYGRVA